MKRTIVLGTEVPCSDGISMPVPGGPARAYFIETLRVAAEGEAVVLLVGVAVLRVAGAHVGFVQRVGGVVGYAVG